MVKLKGVERNDVPRIWIDADPSGLVWTGLDCDDDLAILVALALQERGKLSIEGISVSGGNAPLKHTWKNMQLLLSHAGSDIKPFKGYGWRSMQPSHKLLKWLNMIDPDIKDSNDAPLALLEASHTVKNLIVVTLGPPTNVVKALEQDPSLESRIAHLYMMGGELTQQRLCLNFASDRAATRTLIDANIPTTLITVQLSAQVVIDGVFLDSVKKKSCSTESNGTIAATCALLPKMYQQVNVMPTFVNQGVAKLFPSNRRWTPSQNLRNGFIPWDIIAILVLSQPEIFDEWEYHKAIFPTCSNPPGEPCNRTMTVTDFHKGLQLPPQNHSGIVRIPHVVNNETNTLNIMTDLLNQITAAQVEEPRLIWGFLTPVTCVACTLFTIMLLARQQRHL